MLVPQRRLVLNGGFKMKQLTVYCGIILFTLFATVTCEEFEEILPVEPPSVKIIELNRETLTIKGKVEKSGDGIIEYGFVFSLNNNPLVGTDIILGDTLDKPFKNPFEFTKDFPGTKFPGTDPVFIKAYAIDKHGRVFYSTDIFSLSKVEADFTYSSTAECYAPCRVEFINQSSNAEEYEWDFGDGSPPVSATDTSHTYALPGKYNVSLTAKSGKLSDKHNVDVEIPGITFEKNIDNIYSGVGVIILDDNSYAVVGNKKGAPSNDDIILLQWFNEKGEFIKDLEIDEQISVFSESLIRVGGNNLVIGGICYDLSTNEQRLLLAKVASSGIIEKVISNWGISGYINSTSKVFETVNEGHIGIIGTTTSKTSPYTKDIFFKAYTAGLSANIFPRADTLSFPNYQMGKDIISLSSGGYFIIGTNTVPGLKSDILVLKANDSGMPLQGFPIVFDNLPGTDIPVVIKQLTSDEYIIAGHTNSYTSGDFDIFLMKINQYGEPVTPNPDIYPFMATFGSSGSDITNDLIVLNSGEIVLTGVNNENAFLLKFRNNGALLWNRTFTRSGDINFNSIKETPDGGFIMTGLNVSNGIIIKLDKNGNL